MTPPLWHPTAVRAAAFVEGQAKVITTVEGGRTRLWDLAPETNDVPTLSSLAQFLAGATRLERPSDQKRLNDLLAEYNRPDDAFPADWHVKQANIHEFSGHFFAAAFHLEWLLERRGPSDSLHLRLARAKAELGQWREALDAYHRTTPAQAQKDRPFIGLLELATTGRLSSESKQALNSASYSSNAAGLCWLLALSSSSDDMDVQIRTALDKLPALEPVFSPVLLAALHSALGEHDRALALLKSAGPTSFKDADSLALAALVLATAGDPIASQTHLAEASRTSRRNPVSWEQNLHLELIQRRLNAAVQAAGPDMRESK
jgi:tetratricopeptide (TPR) repeat protein